MRTNVTFCTRKVMLTELIVMDLLLYLCFVETMQLVLYMHFGGIQKKEKQIAKRRGCNFGTQWQGAVPRESFVELIVGKFGQRKEEL